MPVEKPQPATGPGHTRQLRCCGALVGREHHSEGRHDHVELGVRVGQPLRVPDLERDVGPACAGPLSCSLDQPRRDVDAGHPGALFRRWDRDLAGAGGHVEPALPRSRLNGAQQMVVGDREVLRDPLIGAGAPDHTMLCLQFFECHCVLLSASHAMTTRLRYEVCDVHDIETAAMRRARLVQDLDRSGSKSVLDRWRAGT